MTKSRGEAPQARSFLRNDVSLRVGKLSGDDHDQIDERPDTASSQGKDHEDGRADLSDVEPMGADRSQEEAQEQRREPT